MSWRTSIDALDSLILAEHPADAKFPVFGQSRDLQSAPRDLEIVLLVNQTEQFFDRNAVRVAAQKFDRIARAKLARFRDRKVKPAFSRFLKAPQNVFLAEADAELKTRETRLGDDELRRSDANGIARADLRFENPFGRQVLAENGERQILVRVFALPERVVFRRISVNRFADAAVHPQIGLPVARPWRAPGVNQLQPMRSDLTSRPCGAFG